MKNKNVRGIIALALVTALSFGVIAGSRELAHNIGANTVTGETEAEVKALEELDTAGAENIEKAVKTETGYLVTVKTKGYGGDIRMNVSFDADAKTVTKVEVLEQTETDGVGSRIAEAEFLDQFAGVAAPVYLPGMLAKAEAQTEAAQTEAAAEAAPAVLNDGTYVAKTPEADANGYIGEVTMTVADGKITNVVWENYDAEGNKKSVLSENGEYVMTEDGPTWKEQAESLGAALVASQSIEGLGMNEEGKTDAVSGVSINIMGFAALAEECLAQASGAAEAAPAVLNDGTYVAKTPEADANGYTGEVTMTVADGKITNVVWENYDAEGNKKSVLSENGEYVMTEDGPTWKEQAESLGAALVASQSIEGLGMNEEGKTDAVSGVSINIMGFAALAEECLAQASGAAEAAPAVLNDGTYVAKTPEADANGYTGEVTMTVADGKITNVVWENYDAEGNKKSVLSENGEYVMTEDGPTWKEQAESLGAALVASQSIEGLGMNEEGKTDAVSGVSINIMGFAALAEECLAQASGAAAPAESETEAAPAETEAAEAPADGTLADAVSGATISSTAAVEGINAAYNFVQTVK